MFRAYTKPIKQVYPSCFFGARLALRAQLSPAASGSRTPANHVDADRQGFFARRHRRGKRLRPRGDRASELEAMARRNPLGTIAGTFV
jgi:hypothetical protein